ncbi:hypothetical protein DY000_02017278 [Brassica cretica]|uniref:RRM domain-containing protein n=1 Tax=Brassica cretica TaxID=69181 RepID=A0ABQ7CU45_BRACR|nr:hypothetical protein DY000_02017278 [Brassica cretica]
MAEEDDDYDDLYNDVNVGDAFLQSARKTDEVESRNEEKEKVKTEGEEPVLGTPEAEISIPGLVGESVAVKEEAESEAGEGSVTGVVVASSGYGAQERKVGDVSQQVPGGGLRVELGQAPTRANDAEAPKGNNFSQGVLPPPPSLGNNGNLMRPVLGNANGVTPPGPGGNMVGNGAIIHMPGVGNGGGGGVTTLFIGELHWWTTDAELEAELCKYGTVKEVRFFDEKANGKSRGYCQAEFYDPMAAAACKEGMDGYEFNGRPCVVEIAPPYMVKRLGEAQVNRSQQAQAALAQAKRGGPADPPSKPVIATTTNNNGGNFQGGENRGFGRGNWGRGNAQGMGGRGPGGQMRNRPGMGGRAAESSYGEEAASDHQYGEVNHDRGARPNHVKDKERASEREWSGSSDRRNREDKYAGYERDITREKDVGHRYDLPERRHRDDRDTGREREREHHHKERERSRDRDREMDREKVRHREERERYGSDHRNRHRDEPEHDDEWNRGRSSRGHSKSRLSREDNHRSRSRDADYGKRRRLTVE